MNDVNGQVVPEQLKELVHEFFKHDQLAKQEAKLADPLKAKIKDAMSEFGIGEFEHDGVAAVYSVQERTNPNGEKLLQRLRELGFEQAIKTVETVDTAVLERLIYDSEIDTEAIADCFTTNKVAVLTVKAVKAPKTPKKSIGE